MQGHWPAQLFAEAWLIPPALQNLWIFLSWLIGITVHLTLMFLVPNSLLTLKNFEEQIKEHRLGREKSPVLPLHAASSTFSPQSSV